MEAVHKVVREDSTCRYVFICEEFYCEKDGKPLERGRSHGAKRQHDILFIDLTKCRVICVECKHSSGHLDRMREQLRNCMKFVERSTVSTLKSVYFQERIHSHLVLQTVVINFKQFIDRDMQVKKTHLPLVMIIFVVHTYLVHHDALFP